MWCRKVAAACLDYTQKQQTSALRQSAHVTAWVRPELSSMAWFPSGASPCTPTTLNKPIQSRFLSEHAVNCSRWDQSLEQAGLRSRRTCSPHVTVARHTSHITTSPLALPCHRMPGLHRPQSPLHRPTSCTHVSASPVAPLQPPPPNPHPQRAPTPARLPTPSAGWVRTPAQPPASVPPTLRSPPTTRGGPG